MHYSLALCLLTVGVYAWQAAPQRSTEAMQVKQLKVNEVELAYVEEGKGDTIVFVHGGGIGDLYTWEPLRPFISGKFHYVSLSRRYHYPNPWMDDGTNYTMAQHVEDVAAFIRELNVGKVHLVGNSYGGHVVGRVALKYPELLRTVVAGEFLLAPVPPPVSAEDQAAVAAVQRDNEKIREAVQARDVRQAGIFQYDGALGEQGAFEKLPRERQQQVLENAKTIILEQRGQTPLSCEQLRTLSVPALLIRGENTNAVRRHGYEMTVRCLTKTAAATIIPGAPHSWFARNPEDSAKAILTFIANH
jgi:pimeloyl-ACP methyl ester carboxylesterase